MIGLPRGNTERFIESKYFRRWARESAKAHTMATVFPIKASDNLFLFANGDDEKSHRYCTQGTAQFG